jgi:hypothetical protein
MTVEPYRFTSVLDFSVLAPKSVSSDIESVAELAELFNVLVIDLYAPRSVLPDIEPVSVLVEPFASFGRLSQGSKEPMRSPSDRLRTKSLR